MPRPIPDRRAAQQEERNVAAELLADGTQLRQIERARPASAGSASSTAAASLDPPPSPAPIGIRLSAASRSRPVTRIASSTRRAARTTRLSAISQIVHQRDRGRPRRGEGDLQRVGQRDGLEDGAQFVEAVGPLAEHAQVEIDFGQRAHPGAARRSALICRTAAARRRRGRSSCPRPLRKVSSTTKPSPDHYAAGLLHHARRRRGRAAGGQQIVHDQHAVARRAPRPCASPACRCRTPGRR